MPIGAVGGLETLGPAFAYPYRLGLPVECFHLDRKVVEMEFVVQFLSDADQQVGVSDRFVV